MSNQPLISVITPTYNHARYLGRCIDSLLAQTYANWEQVIIDDGSTDNTANVVRTYSDPRITYIRQENRGVKELAATINAGLARTRGSLVTMFPSDDTWPADRLEVQIPVFADPNVILVFGRGNIIDEQDNVIDEIRSVSDPDRVRNRPFGSVLHEMFISNFIPQTTVLIRRSALDKIGGYLQPTGLLAEDYPTHMMLALHGEFRYIDHLLGNYRMHQQQMTRNHYLEMVETDMPYVLRFFQELGPEMQQRSGWTERALSSALVRRQNNTYFEVGRRSLLSKEWSGARRHFSRAFLRGDAQTKIKALLGLGCTVLHTNLELLAGFAGRSRLR